MPELAELQPGSPIPVMAEPVGEYRSVDVLSFEVHGRRMLVCLYDCFDSFFQPVQPRPHEQRGTGIRDIYASGIPGNYFAV
jgi:hypothetical protein